MEEILGTLASLANLRQAQVGGPSAEFARGPGPELECVVIRIFSARVQGGVIVAEGLDLPDGTEVTVAANDADDESGLSPGELAELDAAITEADADDTVIPHEVVLAELDRIIANR